MLPTYANIAGSDYVCTLTALYAGGTPGPGASYAPGIIGAICAPNFARWSLSSSRCRSHSSCEDNVVCLERNSVNVRIVFVCIIMQEL